MNTDASTDDGDLMAAFESAALPVEAWNHRAHLRVAFAFLRQFEFTTALSRMRSGLHALNLAQRVPNEPNRGYHETITVAFMRLIHATCARQAFASSAEFCDLHPELLKKDALLQYYSRERLASAEAKATFLEPDLSPLPN